MALSIAPAPKVKSGPSPRPLFLCQGERGRGLVHADGLLGAQGLPRPRVHSQGLPGFYSGPTYQAPPQANLPDEPFALLQERLMSDGPLSDRERTSARCLVEGLANPRQTLPASWQSHPFLLRALDQRLAEPERRQLFLAVSHNPSACLRELRRVLLRDRLDLERPDFRQGLELALHQDQWADLLRLADEATRRALIQEGLARLDRGLLQAAVPWMSEEQADELLRALPEGHRRDRARPQADARLLERCEACLEAIQALACQHPLEEVRDRALACFFRAYADKSTAMSAFPQLQAQAAYTLALTGGRAGAAMHELNADNNPNRIQETDPARLEQEVARRLEQNESLCPARARREALEGPFARLRGQVNENADYLRGPKFRDRLLMLSGGRTDCLQARQGELLRAEIARAASFSLDPDCANQLLREALDAVLKDPRFAMAPSPEELRAAQTALADSPGLRPDERQLVAQLTPLQIAALRHGEEPLQLAALCEKLAGQEIPDLAGEAYRFYRECRSTIRT